MKKTILSILVLVLILFVGIGKTDSPFSNGQTIPNDPEFTNQWHLHNTGQQNGTPGVDISALEAWEITTGDSNIVIAVFDTGIDLNHTDLVNNLVPGYDFYDDDQLPEPVGSTVYTWHGTACAGLIAAQGNNGIGVTGVTWNCQIMPIRISTTTDAMTDVVAKAFRWAANNGADIFSCSFGTTNAPILESAISDITKQGGIGRDGKGCIILAAAGNDDQPIFVYPAKHPEVIAVGSTDNKDERLWYSNYGPELEIVATGGGLPGRGAWVRTTDISGSPGYAPGDYAPFGGTSSACPIAAGVAALILSIEPELTNDEVRHFLKCSAKDLGDPGRDDYYGWGRIDARAALEMVLARRADLNNNWKVDFEDLVILIEFWGTDEQSADIAPAAKCDGIVDEQDLELLMRYWQTEIPVLPEPGLITHWKLDEIEGDIAYDSAGVNDAVLIGGAAWQPNSGQLDGALQSNGVDSCAITGPVLNPAERPFSIFTWIKGGAPGQVVVSQQGAANWLAADAEGKLITELKCTGRSTGPLFSEAVITDGQWHRIGLVWDGSKRMLYVDGVAAVDDTQRWLASSYGGFYIGCGKGMESDTFFSGLIDDVRIYNRAVHP